MALVDYFLEIDGVKGESADDKHKGKVEIDSFSFGATQMGTHGSGGVGGAGKAQFQDLHCNAHVSTASAALFLACATGEHFKKAVLHCRKAGGTQQDYLTVTMTHVLISSFQLNGSGGGHPLPTESFSLNYGKIEFEYKEQKADGSVGAAMKAGYDVKANKKV